MVVELYDAGIAEGSWKNFYEPNNYDYEKF